MMGVTGMNDSKAMGSLANKMLSFVNTALVHDSNYDIAVILLKNYTALKKMSIGEIADLCYVSKATISRFCRFMGFDNFKEFHSYLEMDFKMNTDYSQKFYAMLCKDQQLALSAYRDELISNIYSTVAPENLVSMPEIAKTLHDCNRIAYFSHHFLWDIGHYFQSKMMMMGRYVEQFLDHNGQLTCARSLGKDDLAIVCSVAGSYPSRYPTLWDAIASSGCRLLVITQNMSSPYWNFADYILRCGNSNQDDVGKYSALMITDMMVINYLKQYDRDSF